MLPFESMSLNAVAVCLILGIIFKIVEIAYEHYQLRDQNKKDCAKDKKRINKIRSINKELIGSVGTTETDLKPTGQITINDQAYEAKSQHKYISKGEKVLVINVKNGSLIVEKLEE